MVAFLDYLPRGNTLSDDSWQRRHTFLQGLLLAHLFGLFIFGLARSQPLDRILESLAMPAAGLVLSRLMRTRRLSSLSVTAGLVASSAALVVLSDGAIEAHFHFFVMIGFIALYQDWVPFLLNVLFTVLSHGVGSYFIPGLMFAHLSGQNRPWIWSLIHGVAVLAACVGVIVFWRTTEDEQRRASTLRGQLAESNKRRFTADLLVNLARRNQNLIYRQLDLLNRLEEHERDAEQLSHLFQLDHLATRIRRNAESLLVLSGEEPARKWGRAVLLVDVVRAAIAEIEELDRVDFAVDESLAVSGRAVADCTHLLAELVENAVHFSPPGLSVMIRTRAYLPQPGAQVLTVEDWGVGMSQTDLAEANDTLRDPRDVDLATSQRLGLHVVARLAQRYKIAVSLEATPGGGVTAVMVLPAALFVTGDEADQAPPRREPVRRPVTTQLPPHAVSSLPGRAGANGSATDTSAPGAKANGHRPPPADDDTAVLPAGKPVPLTERVEPVPLPERTEKLGPPMEQINDDLPVEKAAPRDELATEEPPARSPWAVDRPALDRPAPDKLADRPVADRPAADLPAADRLAAEWPGVSGKARTADRLPTPRTDDPSWDSWWTLPSRAATHRPDPLNDPLDELDELGALGDLTARGPSLGTLGGGPAGASAVGAGSTSVAGSALGAGLARRTPQASLADELRRSEQAASPVPHQALARDPLRASSALSRFQANQRAGRSAPEPEDPR